MDTLKDQPAFTVIDLVAAAEQEAYFIYLDIGSAPEATVFTNVPSTRSGDNKRAIMTGIYKEHAIKFLTKKEAQKLKRSKAWKSTTK